MTCGHSEDMLDEIQMRKSKTQKCPECNSELIEDKKRFSKTVKCSKCGYSKGWSVAPIKGMYPWE